MDPKFNHKLFREIVLTRGRRSRTATLRDSAALIRDLEPFRQARPVWNRAAEMILLPARIGRPADVQKATRQLLLCVERETWWKASASRENR